MNGTGLLATNPDRLVTSGEHSQPFHERYPEFMAGLARLRAYRDRELDKLRLLDERGKRQRARKLLGCPRLKLVYAYAALQRVQRLQHSTPDLVRALAARCDPFAPSFERVHKLYVTTRKAAPGMPTARTQHRLVQSFGPLKRMHQMLVGDLLTALHPPRADQYLLNGGMPMALKAIEDAFREGFTYAVEVDLIDFYGSVRLPGLAELLWPLPASVVENVVWDVTSRRGRDDDIVAPHDEGDPSLSGLVGLSLGAASSPIVGERIIGRILSDASVTPTIAYADNLLVLGHDRSDVEARLNHLREQAARHEAGSLRLRTGEIASFGGLDGGGVFFAKQFGRAIRHRLDWSPSPHKQAEHHVADIVDCMTLEEIDLAERKLAQWRRSYPLWRTGDQFEIERRAELAVARYYLAAQPEHLAAARHAVVIACLLTGIDREPGEFIPDWPGRTNAVRRDRLLREARSALATAQPIQTSELASA